MRTKLTDKQRELLTLLTGDGCCIHSFCTPGREDMRDGVGFFLMKKGDHRDLDGRTIVGLEKRKFIRWDGEDAFITDDGRAVLHERRPVWIAELTKETK